MAIPGWKKLEKSRPVRLAKTRMRQLLGTELTIHTDVDVDTVIDADWEYSPQLLDADSIVYSLGVGDTIEFDLCLIERTGATVHAFDPTPDALNTLNDHDLPPGFHFHATAAAGEDGELTLYPRVHRNGNVSSTMFTMQPEARNSHLGKSVPARTLSSIARSLGHKHVDLVKMDIEGAEYDVIDGLVASSMRPVQVLVEFHHRHKGIDKRQTERAIEALNRVGYRIFSVAENVREIGFLFDGGERD